MVFIVHSVGVSIWNRFRDFLPLEGTVQQRVNKACLAPGSNESTKRAWRQDIVHHFARFYIPYLKLAGQLLFSINDGRLATGLTSSTVS